MSETPKTIAELQALVQGIEDAITDTIEAGKLDLIGTSAMEKLGRVRALPNDIHMSLDGQSFQAALWSSDELATLAGKWMVDDYGVARRARELSSEILFAWES